ncbi:universal stress protein [Haloarchaeobius amylolyticus]|uniref:universal stress protein n=1 Tax=Haloarchaeobius amylolyticus TaxID=1198296 RepID=UPI00226F0B8B|nr:universal stress protein [Haloarchaeobius amylolyticus]
MYDDILLPVDESTESTAVIHHAAELAHWADATLRVLNVADTARDSVTVVENDVVDALVREGQDVVDEVAATLDTLGADYTTDVVQGDPASTIVEYAEHYEYDLIVMPTHGRKNLSRYLLGSVTEKVVRLSTVPVLTARMVEDEALRFPYESLLLATDGSESAQAAVEYGLDLAATLDAEVHVISVVEDDMLGADVRSSAASDRADTAAAEAIDAVREAAAERGIDDVTGHLEHGDPDEVILEFVEDDGVDAVVMGTTGRRGVDRILLGSVAEKTVRSVPVPVITVRKES